MYQETQTWAQFSIFELLRGNQACSQPSPDVDGRLHSAADCIQIFESGAKFRIIPRHRAIYWQIIHTWFQISGLKII